MISVVFIHAYNYTDTFLQPETLISEGMNFNAMSQFWISNGVGRFAVPVFFAISGYLLFIKLEPTFDSFGKALFKRVRTILLPFVIFTSFWSLVTYVVCESPIN